MRSGNIFQDLDISGLGNIFQDWPFSATLPNRTLSKGLGRVKIRASWFRYRCHVFLYGLKHRASFFHNCFHNCFHQEWRNRHESCLIFSVFKQFIRRCYMTDLYKNIFLLKIDYEKTKITTNLILNIISNIAFNFNWKQTRPKSVSRHFSQLPVRSTSFPLNLLWLFAEP